MEEAASALAEARSRAHSRVAANQFTNYSAAIRGPAQGGVAGATNAMRLRARPPDGIFRRRVRQRHGAGCLTCEERVYYPFHPLVGKTVV